MIDFTPMSAPQLSVPLMIICIGIVFAIGSIFGMFLATYEKKQNKVGAIELVCPELEAFLKNPVVKVKTFKAKKKIKTKQVGRGIHALLPDDAGKLHKPNGAGSSKPNFGVWS